MQKKYLATKISIPLINADKKLKIPEYDEIVWLYNRVYNGVDTTCAIVSKDVKNAKTSPK